MTLWGLLGSLARVWLRGTLERAARPALRWGLAIATSYLIAAALAVTAVVFFLSALSNVLVELGVPSWAAQLILGSLTAIIAFIVYKTAAKKRLRPEEPDPSDGVRIRIVKAKPAPRAREEIFDVHPRADADGWEVTSRSPRTQEPFDTKEQALKGARRRAARAENGRVVVHGSNGEIQDVLRYDRGRRR